jgi:hypothetical protein
MTDSDNIECVNYKRLQELYEQSLKDRDNLLTEKINYERSISNLTGINVKMIMKEIDLNSQIKQLQATIYELANELAIHKIREKESTKQPPNNPNSISTNLDLIHLKKRIKFAYSNLDQPGSLETEYHH